MGLDMPSLPLGMNACTDMFLFAQTCRDKIRKEGTIAPLGIPDVRSAVASGVGRRSKGRPTAKDADVGVRSSTALSDSGMPMWSAACKAMQKALHIYMTGWILGKYKTDKDKKIDALAIASDRALQQNPVWLRVVYTYCKVKKRDLNTFAGVEQAIKLYAMLANVMEQAGWQVGGPVYILAIPPKEELDPPQVYRQIIGGLPLFDSTVVYETPCTPVQEELLKLKVFHAACPGIALFMPLTVEVAVCKPPVISPQLWDFNEQVFVATHLPNVPLELKGGNIAKTHERVAREQTQLNKSRMQTNIAKVHQEREGHRASYSSLTAMALGTDSDDNDL